VAADTLSLEPLPALPEDAPLALQSSFELSFVPPERPAPAASAAASAPEVPTVAAVPQSLPDPMIANAQTEPDAVAPRQPAQRTPASTWLLASVAMLAAVGWVIERRRRYLLETEKDSVLWAHVQPPSSSIVTTAAGLDDILPDSPNPAEAARAIYVTAIGETNSRREATLIDLHQLDAKLQRRRKRGDTVAAVLLLQEHLVDFRYTSPWVFLELRELYKVLDRQKEWEIARQAFRQRFGQNAPMWDSPSTDVTELLADRQLCGALVRDWPFREARMFVLRWMLGEHDMRQKCSGPPLLGLGVYRDLMLLDEVLDEVIVARPALSDSLL
jgi:hypothetical protein